MGQNWSSASRSICRCGYWLWNLTHLDRCCRRGQWCGTQRDHCGHGKKEDRAVTYWKEILIGIIALIAGWWLRARPTQKKEIIKAQNSVRKALEEAEEAAKQAAQAAHDDTDKLADANKAEIDRSDRSTLSSLINRVFGGTK